MSAFTMAFVPGKEYRFQLKTYTHKAPPQNINLNCKFLTYLRDEHGGWRSTGDRVIHHLFKWRGGALESFTDEQLRDWNVTKK